MWKILIKIAFPIIKAVLPVVMELVIKAMTEMANEHDNSFESLDAGRMIAEKDKVVKKILSNL